MAKNNIVNVSLASSLPNFSGNTGENVNFFLDRINEVGKLENWSTEKKLLILKLHISGPALQFISNNSKASNCDNFECLANILKDKFSLKHTFGEIQQKFMNMKQKVNQSVKNLVEEVENTTEQYLGITDDTSKEFKDLAEKLKAQKLLDALRPEIKIEVLKLGHNNFENIAKAAKNIEIALESSTLTCNNTTYNTDLEILLKSQIETNKSISQLSKKLDSLEQSKTVNNIQATTSSSSNSVGQQRISCHICGRSHITTKCWYYPRNNSHPYMRGRGFWRNNHAGRRGNFVFRGFRNVY